MRLMGWRMMTRSGLSEWRREIVGWREGVVIEQCGGNGARCSCMFDLIALIFSPNLLGC
jgi:hypothetical protein